MPNRTVYAAIALFLIVATQPGCETAQPVDLDPTDTYSDSLRGTTTVESTAVITYVSSYFAASADASMREISATEASDQVISLMQARIKDDLSDPSCVEVASDGHTYLEVTFHGGCLGAQGRLRLEGSVRADVGFETQPCGPASCPVAVVYYVTTSDLHLGDASFVGNWAIRDPLAADQPYTWNGLFDVVTPERGVTFTSQATFTHAADCVDLDMAATLGGSGQRLLTVETSGLHRCMGSCPTAGAVSITTQEGAGASWAYDGSSGATVTAEGGATYQIGLSCSNS